MSERSARWNSLDEPEALPVAVIGAGPVGLVAAAHLLSRGLQPLVFEAGDAVGASVRTWGHVRVFSPWEFNIDPAAAGLLARHGWTLPDLAGYPTGDELVERYLEPLASVPAIAAALQLRSRVVAVTRRATDKLKDAGRDDAPFELVVEQDGVEHRVLARAVIDASGTLTRPNPIGSGGVLAAGERSLAERITYGIPDVVAQAERYASKRVLVIGAGHSAMNVLQDLVRISETHEATEVHWAVRRKADDRLFGGGKRDGLPERAALGRAVARLTGAGEVTLHTGVRVEALERTGAGITVIHGDGVLGPFDEIIASTGFRPDLSLLSELRLDLDDRVEAPRALAPLIDPNLHSCGSVPPHGVDELGHPDEGVYVVGMKSYGRAPTFLLRTGYEQVRSVVAALAGDWEAARRGELVLPETGVCSLTAAHRPLAVA
jgi:thioredoxin reductase